MKFLGEKNSLINLHVVLWNIFNLFNPLSPCIQNINMMKNIPFKCLWLLCSILSIIFSRKKKEMIFGYACKESKKLKLNYIKYVLRNFFIINCFVDMHAVHKHFMCTLCCFNLCANLIKKKKITRVKYQVLTTSNGNCSVHSLLLG